jgi:hypothetical protein
MKTRLYYSFMVGTAIAMGNMRGNPESHGQIAAAVHVLDSKIAGGVQSGAAPLEPGKAAMPQPQPAPAHGAHGDVSLTA